MTTAERTGTLTGQMIIAGEHVTGTGTAIHAVNPATGERLQPAYAHGTAADVERATAAAREAFGPTAPRRRRSALSSSTRSPTTSTPRATSWSSAPPPRPACRPRGSPARSAARVASSACSPKSCVKAAGTVRASTRPWGTAHRCRAPTSASGASRSDRWQSSVPATSRWPSPSRAATPHRPWPPDARSWSRLTTRIREPPNSSGV